MALDLPLAMARLRHAAGQRDTLPAVAHEIILNSPRDRRQGAFFLARLHPQHRLSRFAVAGTKLPQVHADIGRRVGLRIQEREDLWRKSIAHPRQDRPGARPVRATAGAGSVGPTGVHHQASAEYSWEVLAFLCGYLPILIYYIRFDRTLPVVLLRSRKLTCSSFSVGSESR